MLIQRLCTLDDLAEIERLAAVSPVGVTALPVERERLVAIIEASLASMADDVTFSGEERYFFVLENSADQRLVGCSSIIASAGFSHPFYTFRNEMFVHASREQGLHNRIHVLSLCHDLTGHSLLAGFHLDEAVQQDVMLRSLNVRGRLLFMASHPQRFSESTAVEVVGVSDAEGNAPFWDAVGRHFFAVSYLEAEQLGSTRGRHFLAELMPGYPIYVPMLSDAAQEVIGQAHASAEEVFDILLQEGFETDDYVDIFDGGPVVRAKTSVLGSIQNSQCATVRIGQPQPSGSAWLVSNQKVKDFRAAMLDLEWTPGEELVLSVEQALALQVEDGHQVRLVWEA
ncbi:arginine succinyltransferase [Halopseudomonas xinjiangensis]|uniref:Arginine succinyltransferase n=1 Tax=Halopseudomonas xinjiangensis TaxID=487184 RepID=A0A1H1U7G7_9GAMM|nr:arginine N-succinyltransferase [Halopseudomonas xinjiangensis]SDS68448.1 arginine succinyltransferase [Halopseudomonas xinjiangensis]